MSEGSMTKPLTTEERIAKIRARVAAIPSGAVTLHAPVDVPFLLATIDARDKTIAERDAEIARLREKAGALSALVSGFVSEEGEDLAEILFEELSVSDARPWESELEIHRQDVERLRTANAELSRLLPR